jgi:hypothetical protein
MTVEKEEAQEKTAEKKPEPVDQLVVTRHRARIGGKQVAYTVTCGTMVLKEEAEKEGKSEGERARAKVFFIAYELDGVKDRSKRPLTFSFNGGPGSSSVWLHLGVLGPRRVALDDEGFATETPGAWSHNDIRCSTLPTWFHRPGRHGLQPHGRGREGEGVPRVPARPGERGRVHPPLHLALRPLVEPQVSDRRVVRHHARLGLVVPLARAPRDVPERRDAGVVRARLPVLRFEHGNDLPHILFLPTYAATAWYHKRLAPDLQRRRVARCRRGEAFAGGEYASALFQGCQPAAEGAQGDRARWRATRAPPEYVERTDLRVEIFRFCKELLRDEGRTVGRLDTRYTGVDRDSAGEKFEFDPAMAEIRGAYAAAMNAYVRGDLAFNQDVPYEVSRPFYMDWGWKDFANRYAAVGEVAAPGDGHQSAHEVLVASGYLRPRHAAFRRRLLVRPLGVPPALRKNLELTYYGRAT